MLNNWFSIDQVSFPNNNELPQDALLLIISKLVFPTCCTTIPNELIMEQAN